VLEGAAFECYQSLWRALELRKVFLNEHFPCASLKNTPPLKAYPEARTLRRPYRPEWEADFLDLSRVHTYLAKGQWLRKVSSLGAISIGRQIYHLGYHWRPEVYVELTFDPNTGEFICRAPSGKVTRLSAAWLTKEELMGEWCQFQQIPFQFALPFTSNEWRALLYEQLPARE